MKPSLFEEVVRGAAPPLVPLTTEQYEELTADGVIPEGSPIELIDGFLIYKDRADLTCDSRMKHGAEHSFVVEQLSELLRDRMRGTGSRARCQLPIAIPPWNEPEPDISIVEEPVTRYRDRHPGAADIAALFEVAHSSRHFDRITKQRVYADAGIPVFAIVDLIAEAVEVHSEPAPGKGFYDKSIPYARGTTAAIELRGGVRVELEVNAILP